MKIPFVLIMLLAAHLSFGQNNRDTCMTRSQLYAYKYKMYRYKDLSYDQQFQINMLTELKRIDTVSKTKERIVIHYIGKSDSLLRKVKIWRKGNCTVDSTVTNYNREGLVAYIENWENYYSCDSSKRVEKPSFGKIAYRRYEYDSQGRKAKCVIYGPDPKTYQVIFSYDINGAMHETSSRIDETEFWD